MSLLDAIFPKKCLECRKSGNYLCVRCLQMVSTSFPKCIECRKFSKLGITHRKCKKRNSLDQVVSLWRHDGVVRKSLLSIKYKFTFDVAGELVENYIKNIDTNLLPSNAILIPVPLHKKRKKWRGFNQAEELGRIVASKLNIDFVPDLLFRKINTKPQTELKKKERTKNVKKAFLINQKHKNINFQKNTFIIFDDVTTTGSTLKECGKILKKSGAKKVIGLTICG